MSATRTSRVDTRLRAGRSKTSAATGVRCAGLLAVVVVGVGLTTGCVGTEESAKRKATNLARDAQEGFVELLQTDSREVSGEGRDLADSVRAAYEGATWFGETSETDGRGVLTAYFDGDSGEVSDGLTVDRAYARLCARLEVVLVGERLEVDSADVTCPTEVLEDLEYGPNLPNTFQRLDEDGDLEWVTYEELSRPGG